MFRRHLLLLLFLFPSAPIFSLLTPPPLPTSHHQPAVKTPAGAITACCFLLTMLYSPLPSAATYSSYSARERDWDQRVTADKVQISTARSLKAQLNELVPENQNGSRSLFCPNGESSAVNPLQENRCGDRMAAISVFNQERDIVGNTIPKGRGSVSESGLGGAGGQTAFPKYF